MADTAGDVSFPCLGCLPHQDVLRNISQKQKGKTAGGSLLELGPGFRVSDSSEAKRGPLLSPFLPGLVSPSTKKSAQRGLGSQEETLEPPSKEHCNWYEQRGSYYCYNYCYHHPKLLCLHIHLVMTRDGWGMMNQKPRQLLGCPEV